MTSVIFLLRVSVSFLTQTHTHTHERVQTKRDSHVSTRLGKKLQDNNRHKTKKNLFWVVPQFPPVFSYYCPDGATISTEMVSNDKKKDPFHSSSSSSFFHPFFLYFILINIFHLSVKSHLNKFVLYHSTPCWHTLLLSSSSGLACVVMGLERLYERGAP